MIEDSKTCCICKQSKALDRFYVVKDSPTQRRRRECIECCLEMRRGWHKRNPERKKANTAAWRAANPEKPAAYERKYKYGISTADYEALLEKQNGVCAICKSPPGRYRLSVDHCHHTKKIRGLLCGNCNRMIGMAKDDPGVLRAAIRYICTTPGERQCAR